jgi:predicted  nucleic acid-binding Zn-ribbon protein
MACNTEPSMKRINTLEKRISKIEKKYQETETAFDKLVADCTKFDEFLRNNNTPKPEMQLLRAYLQQYEDERVVIQEEMQYSRNQIANLKDDFNEGLYDASQREEYLSSEESALNTTEAKLDYFLDRFKKQSDFIKGVEKQ